MKLTILSRFLLALLAASAIPALAQNQLGSNTFLPSWIADVPANNSEWRVAGGEIKVLFNPNLLNDLKITLDTRSSFRQNELQGFKFALLDSETLSFEANSGSLENFTAGLLRAQGNFSLRFDGKEKRFDGFSVRPKAGTPRDFELLDSAGEVWFVADHVHFELINNKTRMSMRNMDLRMAAAAAAWMGDSGLIGTNIGSLEIAAQVQRAGSIRVPAACGDPNWHNKLLDPNNPLGPRYQVDVLLSTISTLEYKRCKSTCDGPGGPNDGEFTMAPGATLRNSDTDTTADVPWHSKFSGQFMPHNNDQHPYLIFNVYRVERATGKLEHIARSGAKHAFLTINTGCPTYNCDDNHILWRQCADVYSSGNNDSTGDLGPRSEIIPSKGLWGRCGSIYDPSCSGNLNGSGGTNTSNRMIIKESKVSDTSNFDYFYDSWYVIRDDVNIYNGMGFRKFTPSFVSGTWRSTAESAFSLGAFIDAWATAAPAPEANMVREIVTENGKLKFAVRVSQSGGEYVYQYALQNFDYSVASTEQVGSDPSNLRILAQSAIRSVDFGINASNVTAAASFDGNEDKTDWTAAAGTLRFSASNAADELSWGNILSFTVRSSGGPTLKLVTIGGADRSETFTVQTLVPNASGALFTNGFEDSNR